MRRRTGYFCALVIASIGLLGVSISASASNGQAEDGTCPPPFEMKSVFWKGTPSSIAFLSARDARTGSIDDLICVLDLGEHVDFNNVLDNMVH
jgi:hypothetical protein